MWSVRYLHADPVFRSRDLSIRGIGIHETMPPSQVRRPEGTGDYLFMVFHDPVEFGPPGQIQRLSGGTIVLWPRGAGHFYGDPHHRWSHSWIHCDGRAVSQAMGGARAWQGRPIQLSDPPRVEHYLFDLHEELTGTDKPDRVIVQNTLSNLIRESLRSGRRPRKLPVPDNLLAARQSIDTRYHEKLSLAGLAKQAGLSLPHFCTEFRRRFGAPPIAYLIQRRLHAAAALLRETTMRIGDIGARVGYSDTYYFSRHFKARFGVPPSHVRSPRKTTTRNPP